jgi:Kef-type K+ transport system membrane component KefB
MFMNPILTVGLIISFGFICGEIAERIKLPKVTGFILAGVLLNPGFAGFIPKNFSDHTDVVTNISLCFITFSVGGTLLRSKIKQLGKSITFITFFEAEGAFLTVILGFILFGSYIFRLSGVDWQSMFLPLSLLLGALASPTDPSATLAVSHEYKAKGEVSSTIMGVAAFDDALGLMNFSLASAFSIMLIAGRSFDVATSVLGPLIVIAGAALLGVVCGIAFNAVTGFVKREGEGVLIVLIFAFLCLCFGIASYLKVDELLSTMTMGIVVVNFNFRHEEIFRVLERYTEELIFVFFFTLSGMHFQFGIFKMVLIPVFSFAVLRTIGKLWGTRLGAELAHSSPKVKKYTALGLVPQGGIVVGLALLARQNPAFGSLSTIMINVVIGATVIHELIGPVLIKFTLRKAGEI